MIARRSLLTGIISLACAPAIVRASSIMPVKPLFNQRTDEVLKRATKWAEGNPVWRFCEGASFSDCTIVAAETPIRLQFENGHIDIGPRQTFNLDRIEDGVLISPQLSLSRAALD